jgi:hypothetical protein
LASLRRAHKGESVSETCFYVSQRLVPKFKARRKQVPRLPKDADGNPVELNEHETYYDSDDDAVAPSETLGLCGGCRFFFHGPGGSAENAHGSGVPGDQAERRELVYRCTRPTRRTPSD